MRPKRIIHRYLFCWCRRIRAKSNNCTASCEETAYPQIFTSRTDVPARDYHMDSLQRRLAEKYHLRIVQRANLKSSSETHLDPGTSCLDLPKPTIQRRERRFNIIL